MTRGYDSSRSKQNSSVPAPNSFQSRSFGIQAQTETPAPQQENVEPQAEQTERFRNNLANIPIFAPGATPPAPPKPSFLQTKLTIGQPGDRYEQEADQVAQTVVNRINSLSFNALQRQPAREDIQQQPKNIIQRQWHREPTNTPQQSVEETIQRQRGSGQGLADNIRQPMEQAFGANFSGVRIHTNTQSDQLNQSLQAKAFTTGQDIFFRQGAFNPASKSGQELLAHELTHVVQQNGNAVQPKSDKQNNKETKLQTKQEDLEPLQTKKLSLQECTTNSNNELRLSPADTLVQMNPFSDAWNGLTDLAGKGAAAAKSAMQAVMSLATNPTGLPGVLAGIGWQHIPDNLKAPIINKVLEIEINLIKALPDQGFGSLGFLWPWMKNGILGFLRQARGFADDTKISVANRFAKLAVHGSFEFSVGYLKGLVHGLWDGLTGPFVLIGDIFKLIGKAINALSHLEKYRPLLKELQNVKQTIQANVKAAIKDIMSGKTDPMKMVSFIKSVLEKSQQAAGRIGEQMANALLRFMQQPDGQLGHSLGQLSGNILFEVILAVISGGGYTAVKAAIKPLAVAGKNATLILRKLVDLLPVLKNGLASMAQFAATNPAMKKILSSLESFISRVFDVTKMLYGIEGQKPKPTNKPRPQVGKGNKPKTPQRNQSKPSQTNKPKPPKTNQTKPTQTNKPKPPKTNQTKPTQTNKPKPPKTNQTTPKGRKPSPSNKPQQQNKKPSSPKDQHQNSSLFTPKELKALEQLHPNARAYFEEMVKEFGEPAKEFLKKYTKGKLTLNLAKASQEFGIPKQYLTRVQQLLQDPRAENLAISLRASNKAYLDEGYQLATRAKEDVPVLVPKGLTLPDGRVSDGNLTLGASSLGKVKFKTNEVGLVATKLENAEGELIEYIVVEQQLPTKLLTIMPRNQVVDSSGKFLLDSKQYLPMGADVDMHAVIGSFRNEKGEMQNLTGKWDWETEFPENLKQELRERIGVKRPDGELRTGVVHGPLEGYASSDIEPLLRSKEYKKYGTFKKAFTVLQKKDPDKALKIQKKLILMFKEPVLVMVNDKMIQVEGKDIIMMYRLLGRKIPGVDIEMYEQIAHWIKQGL